MKTLFEPQIVLRKEPDGEYTLHTVTVTPNSCYAAGSAEAAPPPTVRLLPEVQPVLLHIKHRNGRCLQVPKAVRHCIQDLRLGAAAGKTTLMVFAMVGEAIVGSSSIDVSDLGRIDVGDGKDKPTPIDTSDWFAWVNAMPPGPPSLHVTGIVTAPNPGYEARLAPASPQGINPRDLILNVSLTRKPGVWPQVVTQIPVRYDVEEYKDNYDTVLVTLPDGSGIPLKIEKVY